MLISTYDPDSKTYCPTCDKLVKCISTGGNLAFYPRYLDFYHEECGTKWKLQIDDVEPKIRII